MKTKRRAIAPDSAAELSGLLTAKLVVFEPMKALATLQLPRGPGWIYEIKFDGIRALGFVSTGGVRLVSRAGNDLSAKYPVLIDALKHFPVRDSVLDGEIVALDSAGRSSFQLLQAYSKSAGPKPPVVYYVFDLPVFGGKNLAALPLARRKTLLRANVASLPEAVRFSADIPVRSEADLERMKGLGLEGLLAKRTDCGYERGRRSGAWLKFKWRREQEFVIGGFTRPRGSRARFGALLVGYCAGSKLIYAGRVGTGFDSDRLERLHELLQAISRPECPFANLPERLPAGSGSKGLTAAEMRHCTWVAPQLVCQVAFAEWTRDGHLRQPSFLGLREDKRPEEVVREPAGPSGG